jgi:hypothetical protein
MSDNNTTDTEKKSERSSLLGWLGGLAALITAVGGLAALVQSLHSAGLIGSKSLETSGVQQVDDEFKVDAKSHQGHRFQNTQPSTETYEFSASGRWTYKNTLPDQPHGPEGYPILATDNYYLPGYKEGALIVRRENGSYEFIGSRAELTLVSGETVFFIINDTKDGWSYGDNEGTLTVEWNCRTCQ